MRGAVFSLFEEDGRENNFNIKNNYRFNRISR